AIWQGETRFCLGRIFSWRLRLSFSLLPASFSSIRLRAFSSPLPQLSFSRPPRLSFWLLPPPFSSLLRPPSVSPLLQLSSWLPRPDAPARVFAREVSSHQALDRAR